MTSESVPPPSSTPAAMTVQECGAQLAQRFPALFGGAARPLKLRIQADIQARAPGVFTKAVLSAFLRQHTLRHAYLLALTRATQRFDLDGAPSGELSPEHRQAAADELARRHARREARLAQEQDQRRERAALLRAYQGSTLTKANFCALKGIDPLALDGLLQLAREEATQRPGGPDARRRPGGARPHPR